MGLPHLCDYAFYAGCRCLCGTVYSLLAQRYRDVCEGLADSRVRGKSSFLNLETVDPEESSLSSVVLTAYE